MRILIVDDDPMIGRAIQAKLPDHEVVVETDPIEVVARLSSTRCVEPYDVVICDYVMQRMDGVRLVVALRELRDAPVAILISGYEDVVGAALVADAVLMKPFTTRELLDAIDDGRRSRMSSVTKRIRRPETLAYP